MGCQLSWTAENFGCAAAAKGACSSLHRLQPSQTSDAPQAFSKVVNRSDTIARMTRASLADMVMHPSSLSPDICLQELHAVLENLSRLMTTEMSGSRCSSVFTTSQTPVYT